MSIGTAIRHEQELSVPQMQPAAPNPALKPVRMLKSQVRSSVIMRLCSDRSAPEQAPFLFRIPPDIAPQAPCLAFRGR